MDKNIVHIKVIPIPIPKVIPILLEWTLVYSSCAVALLFDITSESFLLYKAPVSLSYHSILPEYSCMKIMRNIFGKNLESEECMKFRIGM